MPIPEDTVTTSPDSPSPAAHEQRTRIDEAPAEKQTPHPSGEWEEPHPGQRYSITVLENARPGVANSNGVGKVGMAAKAYSPYPARATPGVTRRFAPPRLRTPSTRPTKCAGASRLSVQAASDTTPILPRASLPPPPASHMYDCAAAAGPNASSATNLHPRAADPASMDLSASDASSIRLSMTDFSGFLRPGLTTVTTTSTDASSFMDIESEKLPRLSPDDEPDPYGWEAELEKRVVLEPPPASSSERSVGVGEFCPMLQFRRAGGAKRTLLQRVLSFGPAREG